MPDDKAPDDKMPDDKAPDDKMPDDKMPDVMTPQPKPEPEPERMERINNQDGTTSQVYYRKDDTRSRQINYDSNGVKTFETTYQENGITKIIENEYILGIKRLVTFHNEVGIRTTTNVFNGDNEIRTSERTYNAEGDAISENIFDTDGTTRTEENILKDGTRISKNIFNAEGMRTSENIYKSNGTTVERVHNYNAEDMRTTTDIFKNGIKDGIIEYVYNTNNIVATEYENISGRSKRYWDKTWDRTYRLDWTRKQFDEYDDGSRQGIYYYREDETKRKESLYEEYRTLFYGRLRHEWNNYYYQLDGRTKCPTETTKCVASDPDRN